MLAEPIWQAAQVILPIHAPRHNRFALTLTQKVCQPQQALVVSMPRVRTQISLDEAKTHAFQVRGGMNGLMRFVEILNGAARRDRILVYHRRAVATPL